MNRLIALLLTSLMLSSTVTPAVLAGEGNKNRLSDDISKYQKNLLKLNEKIAKVYQELDDGKEPYSHAVKAAEETAEMIGKTNALAALLSESGFDTGTTNLSSQLQDVAIYGFSAEVRESLIQMGYTPEDIEALETKITEYNAYLYRISNEGFTSEEIQSLKDAGYTDSDIENLERAISQRYLSDLNAAGQLNASKNELYQLQTTLSILALKLLIESSEEKGKISMEQMRHLGELEEKLLEDIDKGKWNHIRSSGKELYKYSEMLMKKSDNASEFSVDYFIGMQMHLAAITALEGDEEFALSVVNTYKLALEDLASKRHVEKEDKGAGKGKVKASSIVNPLSDSMEFGAYKLLSAIRALIPRFSLPSVYALPGIIGQVDELREDNNIVEKTITVKNMGEEEFSSMVPFLVVGSYSAESGGLAAVIGRGVIALTTWDIVLIATAVLVVAYVVHEWASNPTVYKYEKERRELPGGKYMIIERNYRLNGEVSVIVKIFDANGNTLVVYHIVYRRDGSIEHIDKKPGRDPAQELPDQNYFPDVYPPPGF